ncbi:conserved hypothetical protein [Candida tropicalis MYA-3404]|uniref:Uncharacterized protein n=1 Tax=Candida tropicalis (strain ATCC MYA-3404 / T1) TaxID=294747 RepID=C5M2N9_CANTT|nr:conserved hypothetical protein [Candida tropicalis MYA-3404]EER35589.1 conserved hypothetical protein [Candida tropicalis MYA-3404]KAG4409697.1 hypothetical protein JTP64_000335 [Candida tropicalis]
MSNTPLLSIKSPRYERITPRITADPYEVVDIINEQEIKNYKLGVILLIIAIATWIIGLELVNVVLKGDDYNKPWLFAVITGSCFAINLIPDLALLKKYISKSPSSEENQQEYENEGMSLIDRITSEKEEEISELTNKEVFILALQISVIYYLYNMLTMSSLQYTSASNQTVMGSTTSMFTLIIGVIIQTEKFSIKKAICVIASCAGVFMVSLSNNSGNEGKFQPKNPLLGNLLALCAALMYAFYLLIMKFKCGTGNRTTNERRLFGYVGIITFILGIPILYVIDVLDIEKFEFPPPSNSILASVIINGVFSVISDYSSILAMLLTSPLVVSLTLTSVIPITIFIDYIVLISTGSSVKTSFVYVFGIICILAAVVLVNVNITTENELIEEVIEHALEEAIRNDEVMSPVLSPLLTPLARAQHHLQSPSPRSSPIGVSLFSPKIKSKHPLRVSHFNLNENDETEPTFNSNHEPLYNITGSPPNIEVIQGKNHQYHIKFNVDS